ncbi:MAG: histidine kinase [Bacteroidales bacterium]
MKYVTTDRHKLFWILHISGWVLLAIGMKFYTGRDLFSSFEVFYRFILTYIIGFALTLLLRYFYRRIFDKVKTIPLALLVIFLSSTLCLILWEPIDVLLSQPFWTESDWKSFIDSYSPLTIVGYYRMNLIWYMFILTWAVLYFGIKNWMLQMEEKIRTEKAVAQASLSKLQMLRYQINPHFLFNALNSIQGLMYKDVAKADLMLTELSEFLRFSLTAHTEIFIAMEEEFNMLEKYLSIQKVRFEEQFSYSLYLQEDAKPRKILCFLTQPLVENAIKHGTSSDPYAPFLLSIDAFIDGNKLVISIKNSGRWIDGEEGRGTGIRNVRERLENAYQDNYLLEFREENGFVTARIEIKSEDK